jgi:hypothetical protein
MRLVPLALIALAAAPAWGQNIDRIELLTQSEFRLLSEDLGGALSYRPHSPIEPLGFPGFDIGVAVTAAKIKNEAILERATTEDVPDILPIPTLRAHLGLPLGFEIGAMYAAVPDLDLEYYGGELKWAFVPGGTAWPAIGVRASFTKATGSDEITVDTTGLDLSISKGFGVLTPYGGIGRVWVKSDPKGNGGLAKEDFELDKFFLGLGLKLAVLNLNFEADKTGDVEALSIKAGLRF